MAEKISERLRAISELVYGGCLLDVGTDHAYLPIWLAEQGYAGRLVASDVCEGPVLSAKENVSAVGLSDRIEIRMADGIAEADLIKPDCIVIAGMGGNLISDIMSASDYPKKSCCRLVLQPMTKAYELRKFLCENGYEILSESLVSEGKIYQIIVAVYCGKPYKLSDIELTLGRENMRNITPIKIEFLKRQLEISDKRMNGKIEGGLDCDFDKDISNEIRRILNDYGEKAL